MTELLIAALVGISGFEPHPAQFDLRSISGKNFVTTIKNQQTQDDATANFCIKALTVD